MLRWPLISLLTCAACAPQVITAVDGEPPPDAGLPDAPVHEGGSGGALPVPEAGPAEPTLRGDALLHRYGFDGSGSRAFDSKGAAHGSLVACRLSDQGSLQLQTPDAGDDPYVDLPNGLISGLTNATFEVWLTWEGGKDWQRIFDFGEDSSGVEDARSIGRSYLFLSPHGSGDFMRAVYKNAMIREVIIDVRPALPPATPAHLAVVFDDRNNQMTVYVNGIASGSAELDGKLSQIHDVNDWLGRSQFAADSPFTGQLDEFRIYDVALTEGEIQKSGDAGPDVVFPEP